MTKLSFQNSDLQLLRFFISAFFIVCFYKVNMQFGDFYFSIFKNIFTVSFDREKLLILELFFSGNTIITKITKILTLLSPFISSGTVGSSLIEVFKNF